jgi:RNA polymerase sigma-70 factor (ECF subfamily)
MRSERKRVNTIACHLGAVVADQSDSELIKLVARGHNDAFSILFERHKKRVYRFALRITGSSATAEDIVNEVFLDVWRQAVRFEGRCQVATWLLVITRNKAVSKKRRRVEAPCDEELASTLEDPADDPEVSADISSRNAVLRQCLRELSPAQREVIDLIYYDDRSVAEAAGIVKALDETVKTRIFYGRKRLSELLSTKGIHSAIL